MSQSQTITLGGGCFWCTEAVYVKVRGVTDVESGYSNGQATRPSYEEVCTGRTGSNEVVKLEYDPSDITLREILEIFFVIHDPTSLNRQGEDRGTQYRSAIYCQNAEQLAHVQAWVARVQPQWDKPIVTEVALLDRYRAAEPYHQRFFEKNPTQGYCLAVAAPKVAKFRQTFAQWQKVP